MDYLDNLNISHSVRRTQDRLAGEGGSMADLLEHFRHLVSKTLIGEREWQQILACASRLPVSLGALPFGFELPLHDDAPRADFGVSVAAGTHAASLFQQRAHMTDADAADVAVARLIDQLDVENSALRRAVGPKLMLEYDVGTGGGDALPPPGLFLRPYARPVIAGGNHLQDVGLAVDALISSVDWQANEAERQEVQRVFLTQPVGTHTDSFGVFPSRKRSIRLFVTGLEPQGGLYDFLGNVGWPGQVSAVRSSMAHFQKSLSLVNFGAHLDVRDDGIGASLGLTPLIKARFSHNRRYFFDDLSEWSPFLEDLARIEFVVDKKLTALASMVSRPTPLFAKTGRYVLLRGIHHIKLAITDDRLAKVKAYVFMVLLS